MAELFWLTIHKAQQLIRKRELSPVELTRALLNRIEAVDDKLHAYVDIMSASALGEAGKAEEEIIKGRYKGALHGIPVAAKDQYDAQNAPARVRLKPSGGHDHCEDSAAVSRLREAGAVFLGKLNMSGLPGGIPAACNPWNREHVPGGSSTGSGAGVAAGLCLGALGEDTAGSIRNPASFCGVAGLKPTYGRVSRYGLAPLSWSLDHCGPMTRVVEDIAHMLQAIAGFDPKDVTSSRAPVPDYSTALHENVNGLIIGVPREYIRTVGADPEVLALVDRAVSELESLGAVVSDIMVPDLEFATIATAVIYATEFYNISKSDLAQALELASESRRTRLYLGALSSAADYIQAQRLRSRMKREFAKIFRKVDVIVLPSNPAPAPASREVDPLNTIYKHLVPDFASPFNLAGVPVLTIPCGFSRSGLPVGLQVIGKPLDEATLLRVGYTYQQAAGWVENHPEI
jgi:aspartyl-tRNA(Asn)/glutamyl-tRNA(Gln) amidotransferase subunit A